MSDFSEKSFSAISYMGLIFTKQIPYTGFASFSSFRRDLFADKYQKAQQLIVCKKRYIFYFCSNTGGLFNYYAGSFVFFVYTYKD